jgi:alpha-tubulin suppressor-like RCC1 family protein
MNAESVCSSLSPYILLVTHDGNLIAWGKNQNDGLLTNNFNPRSSEEYIQRPIHLDLPNPEEGKHDIASVAVGAFHTLVLTQRGKIFVWGNNSDGQLGLGKLVKYAPCPILLNLPEAAGNSKPVKVYSNSFSSKVLMDDGSFFVFGYNQHGELGLGSGTKKVYSPTRVVLDPESPVISLAVGSTHVLALTKNGNIFAWGNNRYGELGSPHPGWPMQEKSPLKLPRTDFAKITCGSNYSHGITKDGDLYAWGAGSNGQLGIGCQDRPFPCCVQNFKFSEIASGNVFSLGLLDDGLTLVQWGNINNVDKTHYPQHVALPEEIKRITCFGAVNNTAFVIDQKGSLYIWGTAECGLLIRTPTKILRAKFRIPLHEKLWNEIFLWIFLGNLDEISEFNTLPSDIVSHMLSQLYFKTSL